MLTWQQLPKKLSLKFNKSLSLVKLILSSFTLLQFMSIEFSSQILAALGQKKELKREPLPIKPRKLRSNLLNKEDSKLWEEQPNK